MISPKELLQCVWAIITEYWIDYRHWVYAVLIVGAMVLIMNGAI